MRRDSERVRPLLEGVSVDFFLPERLRGDHGFESLRARVLLAVIFGLTVMAAIFTAVNLWVVDLTVPAIVTGLAGLMAIGGAFAFRQTGSFVLIGHCGAATLLMTSFGLALHADGVVGPSFPWLILLPLFAMLFAGVRAALMWGAIGIGSVVWMFVLYRQGLLIEQRMTEGQFVLVWTVSTSILIALVVLFFYLNHRLQSWLTEELETKSVKLETIVDTAPNGIVTIDEEGVVRGANRVAQQMFERQESELIGTGISTLIPSLGDDVGAGELSVEVSTSTALPSAGGHTGIRGDDEEFPIGVSVGRFTGPPTERMVLVLRDDSEMREMRAKMMQMDRMSAVGTLATGVGHEINNPLSYIKGNLQYLHRQIQAVDGEELDLPCDDLVEAAEDSLHGLQRVANIVEDLRGFASRGDTEQLEAVDVEEVVESTLSIANNKIRHRATLRRDYGEIPAVLANEESLGQVMLNLVLNAAEAIPEGGAEEHYIDVRTEIDDDKVAISVCDTGHGIADDDMARIFDPFFTTRGPEEGTGLGLSISQKIINEMGGHISVESELGEGSTFTVRLPVAPINISNHEQDVTFLDLPEPCDGRVLIVDDEQKVCRAIERTLERSYDVDCVTDAAEVFERLDDGADIDVLLVDVVMPRMTGRQLVELLEEHYPDLATRVILMSGGAFTPEARDFLEDCELPFVEKPFEPSELFDTIEAVRATS